VHIHTYYLLLLLVHQTAEYTRQSCVVSWLQLDNQTLQPHAPVVLAPTPVPNPRPTLQVSVLRNNAKSHKRLGHLEYVGLLLQVPQLLHSFDES
jgi:hypothetical protein